jgi:hypothetical protein
MLIVLLIFGFTGNSVPGGGVCWLLVEIFYFGVSRYVFPILMTVSRIFSIHSLGINDCLYVYFSYVFQILMIVYFCGKFSYVSPI